MIIPYATMFAITPTACSAYVTYEGVVDYGVGLATAVKVINDALEVQHNNPGAGVNIDLDPKTPIPYTVTLKVKDSSDVLYQSLD